MFNTHNHVKLSDFSGLLDTIFRDATFRFVGKIPSRMTGKLVPLTSNKYLAELQAHLPDIAAVVCLPDIAQYIPAEIGCAVSSQPVAAAFHIHAKLHERKDYYWTDFDSQVSPAAKIHPRAVIADKNVVIGANSSIGPGAIIHERSVIGVGCFVGAATVIGCEAFEVPIIDGRKQLHPQAGGVRLGDHVVICSNSSIAKSSYAVFTEIGEGCMIDNHVHIAHDCVLETGCTVTHGSLLAGRVHLEQGVYIGPNTSISNGIHVKKNATVTIGSTVVKDVAEKTRVTGNFAIEHSLFIRNLKRSVE